MFVVYSNRQMLPIIREVEYDGAFPYRVFEEAINVRQPKPKDDYYAKILEKIDEEYIEEHTENFAMQSF